ncbi:ABC transporter substrate-binding protein [Pleomorphomonas diazotrophica]|uniref:ABC transporter substrate-binding protein n=1 Tax=Pleomorphomonas diazotrophica TaxID=1166257 RepID=A0A1I4QIN1_9HYPH|nr:TRAP transporter substrate-binding protein [Pleomorphomonas diazotrophica]PKR90629.1 ABC transporter substrate-binding protein [Pleomorphomonas diazotrophica]SFM39948.1 tripartite ATP-independent transporter solute receptor, DctP family [Pleomorphomonas diazotrophica]
MPILTRRAFAAGLTALALPSIIRPARAAPRTLTVASLLGDDKPETKIWLKVRDLVEAKLPGRFDFRIVGNAALGGEKEVAEGIRLDSIQASLSTMSVLSAWVPETQLFDLPFVFRDRDHVRRATSGPIGDEFKQTLTGQGFVTLGFINYGARHLLAKEAVTTPEGVAEKRIRVIQSPLHVELWKAYGALPTPIPITETYNALKTGVVDMMDLTKSAYAGFRLYEVVPYLIETAHIWATGAVYLSAGFWNSLADDEKTVFAAAISEGSAYFDELMQADETVSMEAAKAAGGQTIVPEDRDSWAQGAESVWTALAPKVGGIERIKALAAL